jgi:hypothetical protein
MGRLAVGEVRVVEATTLVVEVFDSTIFVVLVLVIVFEAIFSEMTGFMCLKKIAPGTAS